MGGRPPRPPDLLVVKVGGSCLEQLAPEWWDRLAELVGGGEQPVPGLGASAGGADATAGSADATAGSADATAGSADATAGSADATAAGEPASSAGAMIANARVRRPPTKLVVVHGWSRMVSAATPEGQPDFIFDKHGFRSRYTTAEVLEEIERVAAELRERIADLLRERGLLTQAVSGAGARLLHAEVRRNMWWVDDELVPLTNLVGPVREVDRPRLDALLAESDAIVVSPLAVAADHPRVNTDADRAAAAIAGAGGAERLVLVMDAEAVLADGEPVRDAVRADLRALAKHAEGGMAKKLRAVEEAFAGGVREVAIGSAAVPDLLAGRAGTLIVAEPSRAAAR
jgi:acetylglutamate kinase/acetylglutamate/LysW-gamma-L-alpha-aminoadipate kinase